MKKCFNLLLVIPFFVSAQTGKPKAVIGIVVDQMRQEYLYRFAPKYGDGGFKRLMNQGFMVKNAHYNYIPTLTGPGHATVYTGATPSVNGVIGNEWYERSESKTVNCVEDRRFAPVGTATAGQGMVSPFRMLSTTVTDELKLSTQGQARVIGISIKDRGAVLPAGHIPDGAFWYDGSTGNFISSTYYKPGLPMWVEQFNQLKLADKYLSKEWNTLLPIGSYTECGPDNSRTESIMRGKDKPVFPYNLPELRKANGDLDLITRTPFGDDLLTDLAKAAIDGAEIGKDAITDFLAISYSTPDLIGHAMGPNSVEVMDTYLRLDRNIQDLLSTLDKKIGAGQYIVFLTADHAVADIPQDLISVNIPAGYFNSIDVEKGLQEHLQKYFPGQNLIEDISNNQVYLNPAAFPEEPKSGGLNFMVASELVAQFLRSADGVAEVFTKTQLLNITPAGNSVQDLLARGMNSKRSGDIVFTLKPGWSWAGGARANHGSGHTYDTHIPMLFYGKGIKHGVSYKYHSVTDIAPTISALLDIKMPNGCSGQPVEELFH
jgi:predicted AlkP superfamily pyrophosphatase or phosphodiesterase